MSGHFEIPGLTFSLQASQPPQPPQPVQPSQPAQPSQPSESSESSGPSEPAQPAQPEATQPQPVTQPTTQKETEPAAQEDGDTAIPDAPPSPPSLTSALEALLGGLEPSPPPPSAAPAQPNGSEPSGQANGAPAGQVPEDDQKSEAGWEEDSSPYVSSSDSSSSDDSDDDDSSEDARNYKLLGPEETARILMEMEGGSDDEGDGKARGSGSGAQVRTKNEIPEEVIPKPDVTLAPDAEITELGVVEHIVESTVVIKAHTTGEYSVLDSGSVLCTADRTVVAALADLIGNVRQPRYTARFASDDEIRAFGLELGAKVFYPPAHASYVFTQALRGDKGTDASNWHDEEVGDDEMEFSDDEKEAEHRRQLKAKKKGGRGGKTGGAGGGGGGAGARAGQRETPSSSAAGGSLKYDDDDDDEDLDGPYRKLTRPPGFGQGPQAPPEPGNGGSRRAGRSRGPRNHGFDRGARGNRGGPRSGHSLPPRPSRGQEYPPQAPAAPPPQHGYPPMPLAVANAVFPPLPPQFQGMAPPSPVNGGHPPLPHPPFSFPWAANVPQGFFPPPPPQFTAAQPQPQPLNAPGAGTFYNPAFFAALQSQMQHGQPGPQNGGHWPRPSGGPS
ncbi:NAF1-domain-containing protein [Durotheca rogersii]|uniref:NAF1-domain-containing protein n=1 Tax=Durotheca rogersii TaxID=419775 RepID=UPI0022207E8F|nr:NAF1-domain-containing protein [Durotheca rogersii]KAI5861937.1 NAF1-domain-containing protein [Durotheca rogersii]